MIIFTWYLIIIWGIDVVGKLILAAIPEDIGSRLGNLIGFLISIPVFALLVSHPIPIVGTIGVVKSIVFISVVMCILVNLLHDEKKARLNAAISAILCYIPTIIWLYMR